MKPAEFLRELWGEKPPGHVCCWRLSGRRSFFPESLEDADRCAGETNVYTRVTTTSRTFPQDERGGEKESHALCGLFLDLDLAEPIKPNGLPNLDAAMELAHLKAEPTIVVRSGVGIQPWYLFEEPWTINGDLGRARGLVESWGRVHLAATDVLVLSGEIAQLEAGDRPDDVGGRADRRQALRLSRSDPGHRFRRRRCLVREMRARAFYPAAGAAETRCSGFSRVERDWPDCSPSGIDA